MKHPQVFRVITIALFISLLMITIPVAPVQAAGSITLSQDEGDIGDSITVTGTGFNKSTATTDKYAAIYFSSDEANTLDDIDDEVTHYETVKEGVWLDQDGEFEVSFTVPDELNDGTRDEDVESGTYYIYVCHYINVTPPTIAPRIRAVATFTVTMGEISLSSYRSSVGTPVEIEGIKFAGNQDIMIKYDDYVMSIESGDRETRSNGSFRNAILIPNSTSGLHTVTAIVSESEAEAQIFINPHLEVSPTTGAKGSSVMVRGTGFGGLKTTAVWFQGNQVAVARTNALGNFSANFNVPELGAGVYSIDVDDGINAARAGFTIVAPPPSPAPAPAPQPTPAQVSVSLSATTGDIGQGIVMGGAGFKPDKAVTIEYDGKALTTITTDSNGVFAAAFTVPPSKSGDHTLTISDGTATKELTFTIEAQPPPRPALLQPTAEAKVEAPVFFNWSDVIDSSPPVTYMLQVAKSADFSAMNTVLEEKEITKSEYYATAEENVKLSSEKTPYYWRIKAIDGAQNESNWTNAETFSIATSFPSWLLYLLIALGAVLFFALGYFSQRRGGLPKG